MLMEKIGIFYGSTTGITESVAYRLAELMHVKKEDLHDVARSKPSEIGQYDLLLLGSSTWGSGDLQDDWYDFLDGIETLDLKDKTIALFGCGDQSMSDTFCNAVGTIYHRLQKNRSNILRCFRSRRLYIRQIDGLYQRQIHRITYRRCKRTRKNRKQAQSLGRASTIGIYCNTVITLLS